MPTLESLTAICGSITSSSSLLFKLAPLAQTVVGAGLRWLSPLNNDSPKLASDCGSELVSGCIFFNAAIAEGPACEMSPAGEIAEDVLVWAPCQFSSSSRVFRRENGFVSCSPPGNGPNTCAVVEVVLTFSKGATALCWA